MATQEKITRQDLEDRFRSLQDGVNKQVDEAKQPLLAAGA
ncbi:MAG: hypothetical protein RL219_1267, partial [Actinomycetota bacterium]